MAAELKEPVVSRHPDDYIRNMKCLNVATQFVAISKGHLRDLAQPDNEMAALSPSFAFKQIIQRYSARMSQRVRVGMGAAALSAASLIMNGSDNSVERNAATLALTVAGCSVARSGQQKRKINNELVDWAFQQAGPTHFPAAVERVQQEISRQTPGLKHAARHGL